MPQCFMEGSVSSPGIYVLLGIYMGKYGEDTSASCLKHQFYDDGSPPCRSSSRSLKPPPAPPPTARRRSACRLECSKHLSLLYFVCCGLDTASYVSISSTDTLKNKDLVHVWPPFEISRSLRAPPPRLRSHLVWYFPAAVALYSFDRDGPLTLSGGGKGNDKIEVTSSGHLAVRTLYSW